MLQCKHRNVQNSIAAAAASAPTARLKTSIFHAESQHWSIYHDNLLLIMFSFSLELVRL